MSGFGARLPLLLAASPRGGRGVFAGRRIDRGAEVEVCGAEQGRETRVY